MSFLAFSDEGLCSEVEAGLRNQPGRVIHTQTPESGKSSPPPGLMPKGQGTVASRTAAKQTGSKATADGAMIPEHLLQLGLTGAFQWRLSVLVRYCHAEAGNKQPQVCLKLRNKPQVSVAYRRVIYSFTVQQLFTHVSYLWPMQLPRACSFHERQEPEKAGQATSTLGDLWSSCISLPLAMPTASRREAHSLSAPRPWQGFGSAFLATGE